MRDATQDHARDNVLGARALGLAILLNVTITVLEAIVGAWTGSLALLADALHNLADVGGLVLAWVSARLALRPATASHTFGWLRAEPIVALVNGMLLLPVAGSLVWAALHRLGNSAPPSGALVMTLGAVALAVNVASAFLLRPHASGNLGTKSALLHLVTDAAASGAVVLGGALMWAGVPWVDALLAASIGLLTLKGALGTMREAAHMLADGAPVDASATSVAAALSGEDGVVGVHHVHVWSISTRLRTATAHVVVSEATIAAAQPVVARLSERLRERLGIAHTTFQLEPGPCGEGGVLADPRPLGSVAP